MWKGSEPCRVVPLWGPAPVLPVLSQVPPGIPPPRPVLHKYLRSSCLNPRAPRCLPGYLSWRCVR